MKMDKDTINKIKPWMLLALFCAGLVYLLMHALEITFFLKKLFRLCIPFFYAIGISYVLNLPMSWFEQELKKRIPEKSWLYKKIRSISILLTLVLALIIITVLLSIIIPQLINNVMMLLNNLVGYIENIIGYVNSFLSTLNLDESLIEFDPSTLNKYLETLTSNWETMLKTASSWVGDAGQMILKNALAFTAELANWFTGFMLSLYMLSSKETFLNQIRKIIAALFSQETTKKIFDISAKANDIFASFISGQLLEACILSMLIYFGMKICGLGENFEILISIFTGVTSIIPMFGAMLAMCFGAILIFANNPLEALIFIIFYQIIQQFEGNVIYPKVVGKSVGLPAVWVLLSIIVFGGLFGLLGMFIAVPSTALIYSLIRDFINWRIQVKNIDKSVYQIDKIDQNK